MLYQIFDSIRDFIRELNSKGVPLPLIRLKGKPSFTGTMTLISFNTALLGQIGKVTKILGEVDLTQANYLFAICLAAHFGRSFSKDKEGGIHVGSKEEKKKEGDQ